MPHESGGHESEVFSRRTKFHLIYCVLVLILYSGGISCRPNPQFQLPFRLPSFLGPAFSSVQNLPVPNGIRRHSQQHIDAGLEYGRQHRRILLPHIYRVGDRPNGNGHGHGQGLKNAPNPHHAGHGQGQGQGQSSNEPFIIAMSHPIYPVQNLPREPLMEAGSQLSPVFAAQPQITIPKHIPIPVPVPLNFIPGNPEIMEQRMREDVLRYTQPEPDDVDHDHHDHEQEHEQRDYRERPQEFEERLPPQPQPPVDHPKISSAHVFEHPQQLPPKLPPTANVLYRNPEFDVPKVHLIEVSKAKELEHPKVKEFLQSLFPSLDASQSPSSNHFEIRSPPPTVPVQSMVTGSGPGSAASQDFVLPPRMVEHIENPPQVPVQLQQQQQNHVNFPIEHNHSDPPPKPPVENSSPYTFYSKSPLIQPNSQYLITFKQAEGQAQAAPTQAATMTPVLAMQEQQQQHQHTGSPILSTIPILGMTELYPGAPVSSPVTPQMISKVLTTIEAITSPEIEISTSPVPNHKHTEAEAEADVSNSIEENIDRKAEIAEDTGPTDQSMSATLQFPLFKLNRKHFQFVSEKVDVQSVFGGTKAPDPEPPVISTTRVPPTRTRAPTSLSIGLNNAVDRILRGESAQTATTTTTTTPPVAKESSEVKSFPKIVRSGKFKNLTAVLVEAPEDFDSQFIGLGKNFTSVDSNEQQQQQIVEFRSRLDSLPLGKRSGQINGNGFGGRPPIPKEEDLEDYDEEDKIAASFNSNKTNPSINENANTNNLIPETISIATPSAATASPVDNSVQPSTTPAAAPAPIIPEIVTTATTTTISPIAPEVEMIKVTTARISMPIIVPNLTIINENEGERKPVEEIVQHFESDVDAENLLDMAARFRYAEQYPQIVSEQPSHSQILVSQDNVPSENPNVIHTFPNSDSDDVQKESPGPEFPITTTTTQPSPSSSEGQTDIPESDTISSTEPTPTHVSTENIVSTTTTTTAFTIPEITQEELTTTTTTTTSTTSPDIISSTNSPIILQINSTAPSPSETTEEDGSDMMSTSIGVALAEMGIEIVSSPSPADPIMQEKEISPSPADPIMQEKEISPSPADPIMQEKEISPSPTPTTTTEVSMSNEILESTSSTTTSPPSVNGVAMIQELLSGFMSRSTPESPVATTAGSPELVQDLVSTTEVSTTSTTESAVNRGMMLIQKFISDMMAKNEPGAGVSDEIDERSEGTNPKLEPEATPMPMSILPTTQPPPTEMAESGKKLIDEMLSQMAQSPSLPPTTFPDSPTVFPEPPRLRPLAPVGMRRKRPNFATVLGTKQQPMQMNSFITPMLSDTPLRPKIPSTAAQTRRRKLKQVLDAMTANKNNANSESESGGAPLQRLPMFSSPPSRIPSSSDDSNSIEPESLELNLQIPARAPGSIRLRPTAQSDLDENNLPTRSTTSLPAFHKVTRITTTMATTTNHPGDGTVSTTFRSRRRFKQQPIRPGDYNNFRMRKLGESSTTSTTTTQKPKINPRKKHGYLYSEPTRPLVVFPPPPPQEIFTSTATTTTTLSTTTTTTTTTTPVPPIATQDRFGGESSEESEENNFYADYSDLPPASMPDISSEELPKAKSTSRPPRIQIKSTTTTTTPKPEEEMAMKEMQAEMMSSNEIPKSLESEEKMDSFGSSSTGSGSGSSEIPEKKSADYLLDYEEKNLSKGKPSNINLPVVPPAKIKDPDDAIHFEGENSVRLMSGKSRPNEPPSLPAIADLSDSYDDLPPLPGSFEEDNKNFGLKASSNSNLGRPPPPGLPLSDYEEEPDLPPIPQEHSTTSTTTPEAPTTTTTISTTTEASTTTTTTTKPTSTEPPSISVDPAIFAVRPAVAVPESTSEATLETIKPNVESKRKKMSKVTKTGPSYSAMTVEITRPLTLPTASPTPSNEEWLREVALKALDRGIAFQQVFSINIGNILLRRTSMAAADGENDAEATTPLYLTQTEDDKENGDLVNLSPTETVGTGTSYVNAIPQSSTTSMMPELLVTSSSTKYPPIFAMRAPIYIAPSEKPVVEDVPFKFTPDYAPPPVSISKKVLQIEPLNATEKSAAVVNNTDPPSKAASSYSDEEYFDESFESRLSRMSNSARSVKLTRLWRRNGGER